MKNNIISYDSIGMEEYVCELDSITQIENINLKSLRICEIKL